MPVLEGKSVVLLPAQSAGERAPEAVATPATEVRAPEPTPVAPHERERRSTPPIPAPRVSWRLLLLISSDTARPSLREHSDFSSLKKTTRVCGFANVEDEGN
jgi:hypothetical protein